MNAIFTFRIVGGNCNSVSFPSCRFCECGYSRKVHSDEALHKEFNQSEPLTKTLPTDAFGKLDFVEDEEEDSDWKTKLKNIRVLQLTFNF